MPSREPAGPGFVHVYYAWPADLHRAAKTIASARGISLKAFLIEALTNEVARGYDPARGAQPRR